MKRYGEIAASVQKAVDTLREDDPDFIVSSLEPGPFKDDSLEYNMNTEFVLPCSQGGVPVKIVIRIGRAALDG